MRGQMTAAEVRGSIVEKESCECCGSDEQLRLCHVVESARIPRASFANVKDYLKTPLNFQFLCDVCERSRHGMSYCRVHNRYVGLWADKRGLPALQDISPDLKLIAGVIVEL